MLVTLEEAKTYLRIDSADEDSLIASLISAAENLCMDVARLTPEEWDVISAYTSSSRKRITIHNDEKHKDEILHMKELLRISMLYTLGYLSEHREEADHHALALTLRSLLFEIREGVV